MPPETILDEASCIVDGERQDDYGHPLDDFTKTASMWSVILGCKVSPEQIPLCMIAVKISRELNKHNRDNLVDIAGYARTLEKVLEEKDFRNTKCVDAKDTSIVCPQYITPNAVP